MDRTWRRPHPGAVTDRSSRHARWRAPTDIRDRIRAEIMLSNDSADPWPALERAHLLSQPWAWFHIRVHAAMLCTAVRGRERNEALGQVVRLIVAGPGSLARHYPPGNTGRVSMRLSEHGPVPADIAELLAHHGVDR